MTKSIVCACLLLIGSELRAGIVSDYRFDEGPVNQPAATVVDSSPNHLTGTGEKVAAASLPIFRPAGAGMKLEFTGTGEALPTAASYIAKESR